MTPRKPDNRRLDKRQAQPKPAPGIISVTDTSSPQYAHSLQQRESATWKRWLDVQRPYRWNLRRLEPGFLLDVGCGLGRNLTHVDGRGVGVDHNAHSVGIARQRGLRAYLPDEFAESEWNRPGRFDSLLLAHVAEHLPKSEAQDLLERYLPNVKPGGKVIVIVPQQAGFRADDSHVRRVGAAELSELAEALGLRIARIYSYPFPEWVGRLFVHNETVMVCRR